MITADDEWCIHKAATEAFFAQAGVLGYDPRYNTTLNSHERVAELAESLTAELLVARYFGLEQDASINRGKMQADVGTGLEIKWTRYSTGHLIIYPHDRDADVAVLVVGKSPTLKIVGWIPISFAKTKRYRHGTQDTWWIDQSNLNPIENLLGSSYGTLVGSMSGM